jgi:hypothetical protein
VLVALFGVLAIAATAYLAADVRSGNANSVVRKGLRCRSTRQKTYCALLDQSALKFPHLQARAFIANGDGVKANPIQDPQEGQRR